MDWMTFYRPDLPISVVMLDENETEKESFDIAPADGPLFMTVARLPLHEKAVPGGLIVPVGLLAKSGFFVRDSATISRYKRARIVFNNAKKEI